MRKRKIAFICTNADLAGAPVHVKTLILGLQHRADILAFFGERGPIVEELESAGIKCYILARMRSNISPINDLISLCQLTSLLLRTAPDLVHIHSAKAGMIGRLVCFFTRRPWVYTVHGWGWRGFGKIKSRLLYVIEKGLSIGTGGFYIYVSKSVEADAINKLKIESKRGRVIFNAVQDFGVAPEPSGALRILMAARVCSAKDHETLIRAFDRISVPSKLLLCGEHTDSDEFRNFVHKWAPNRYLDIELLGVRKDVRSLLQSVNIFTLISHFEALPISIIEAMASNRAVIATDVGGVSELIERNVSGLIIPRGGIQELADGFTRLQNPDLRSNLSKNARLRYQSQFNEADMLDKVWDVYLEQIDSAL